MSKRRVVVWPWIAAVAGAIVVGILVRAEDGEPTARAESSTRPSIPATLSPTIPSVPQSPTTSARIPERANVVLITIDTLRADGVGFMGYPRNTTPNLDALAQRGIVFDRAYALASYTGKSVGPMLIGKYPSETERDGNHFTAYAAANVLLTERLHAAGVRTMGAASHWYFEPWSGLSQGMDAWDTSARPTGGQGEGDTSVTSVDVSNRAIELLSNAENATHQFFAWFHYLDPHAQYVGHDDAPDFLGDAAGGVAAVRAAYDAEVWFTDREVGRVLDFVSRQPFADRTIIVVTSDHGEAFGDHGMSWHGIELWECLVRVPLVVHVPGVAAHHVGVKRSHIDLAPTVLALMGVDAPGAELSGTSMLPDIVEAGPHEDRDVLLDMPVGPYSQMRRGFITGDMKLVQVGSRAYQLYDLVRDPEEREDLASVPDRLSPVLTAFERATRTLKAIDVPPGPP